MSRQARLAELQNMDKKRKNDDIGETPVKKVKLGSSISMTTTYKASKAASPPSVPKSLPVMTSWDKFPADYITWNSRGKKNVKLVKEGERKQGTFLLCPMMVRSAELGEHGNLDDVKEITKARFTIELESKCPEDLVKHFPDIKTKQKECMEMVHKTINGGLEYCFHEDELWEDRNKDDIETFMSEAHHSWLKEYTFNRKKSSYLKMSKRLTSYDGKPNRPTFWKKNIHGTYDVLEVENLPEGSLVSVQVSIRYYNIEDSMYGVSMDIGDNILVSYMPKPKSHTDDLPFIDF